MEFIEKQTDQETDSDEGYTKAVRGNPKFRRERSDLDRSYSTDRDTRKNHKRKMKYSESEVDSTESSSSDSNSSSYSESDTERRRVGKYKRRHKRGSGRKKYKRKRSRSRSRSKPKPKKLKRQKRKSDRRSKYSSSESESEDAKFERMFAKFTERLKSSDGRQGETSTTPRREGEETSNESGRAHIQLPLRRGLARSMSESTLYVPAVKKALFGVKGSPTLNSMYDRKHVQVADIARVLNNIHIGNAGDESGEVEDGEMARPVVRRELPPPPPEINFQEECARKAKEAAEANIVDAEKLKAQIAKPGGKSPSHSIQEIDWSCLKDLISEVKDEKIFHLTCHVDLALREKCEKGEFIDLIKLIMKPQAFDPESEERPYEVVSKNGQTYFAPKIDRENKITNVRKWEEAFRVYATLYCRAKPERSPEVWQYVETINWATQRYVWENVAYYDYIFRRLMAEYPDRSWAKTYSHMCKRALVD